MDAKCKALTASWVRERHLSNPDIEVCDFYESLERSGNDAVLEPGTVFVTCVENGLLASNKDMVTNSGTGMQECTRWRT